MAGKMSAVELESAISDIIQHEADEYGRGAEHQLALFVLAYARGNGPQWFTRFVESKKQARERSLNVLLEIERFYARGNPMISGVSNDAGTTNIKKPQRQ